MRVFFLTCGRLRVPEMLFGQSPWVPPWRMVDLAMTVAVAVRDNGDVVLVDAGWSQRACESPFRELGSNALLLGVRVEPAEAIVRQLAKLGIAAGQVRQIVATHMHLDHIGAVTEFPNAELVCTSSELDAWRNREDPRGYREEDLGGWGRIRPLELDGPREMGFPGSADLFGDGTVTLLDARGHTRGSCAVRLRESSHDYLHVGDAVYRGFELDGRSKTVMAKLRAANGPQWDGTRDRISDAMREAERELVVVPSHDLEIFAGLPHALPDLSGLADGPKPDDRSLPTEN